MNVMTDWERQMRKAVKKQKRIDDQIFLDNYLKNLKKEHEKKRKETIEELEQTIKKLRQLQ